MRTNSRPCNPGQPNPTQPTNSPPHLPTPGAGNGQYYGARTRLPSITDEQTHPSLHSNKPMHPCTHPPTHPPITPGEEIWRHHCARSRLPSTLETLTQAAAALVRLLLLTLYPPPPTTTNEFSVCDRVLWMWVAAFSGRISPSYLNMFLLCEWVHLQWVSASYGVATIRMLLKITGLFCRISSLL